MEHSKGEMQVALSRRPEFLREERRQKTIQPCHVLLGPNRHDETANNLQVKVKTETLAAGSKITLSLIHDPFLFSGIIEILGLVMKDFRIQKSFNLK